MRTRHYVAIAVLLLFGLPLLWLSLAYGGLPRLWSHHEHKKMAGRAGNMVSYTAQDIPGDPLNLQLVGSEAAIDCAFAAGGWSKADPLSPQSAIRIGLTVLSGRPYPSAPVSPLYVADQQQALAYEIDEGPSAKRRHHVRLWPIGPNRWIGAASFDRGVGLSLFTLQITHHIGPDLDAERHRVEQLVLAVGGRSGGLAASRLSHWRRNGGGDRYVTDGQIETLVLPATCPVAAAPSKPPGHNPEGDHA